MPQASNRVAPSPLQAAEDGRALCRAKAEELQAKLDAMTTELTQLMVGASDISFVQTSCFQETVSLFAQAKYMLGLARK